MQTFYTITLSAKVFREDVDYIAYWNGHDFERTPKNKWCSINREDIAQQEFSKVTGLVNPNHWKGRYKISLISEQYEKDNLLTESVINIFQTQNY